MITSAAKDAIIRLKGRTPEMAAWRADATCLGDESEDLFGVRNIGLPKIDQSLRDIPSLTKALKQGQTAGSKKEKRKAIEETLKRSRRATRRGMIFW